MTDTLKNRLLEILNRNLSPWTFDGSEPFTQELLLLLTEGAEREIADCAECGHNPLRRCRTCDSKCATCEHEGLKQRLAFTANYEEIREELDDLRKRHENLKANEARIREHYLAQNDQLQSTTDTALARVRELEQQAEHSGDFSEAYDATCSVLTKAGIPRGLFVDRVREAIKRMSSAEAALARAEQERDNAQNQCASAERALNTALAYVQHKPECPQFMPRVKLDLGPGWVQGPSIVKPCTCGLASLLVVEGRAETKEQGDTRVDGSTKPAGQRATASTD